MSARDNTKLIATLAELFPKTFSAEAWQEHRPLKIGIGDNLRDAGVLLPQECRVLAIYTHRRMYQACLALGGPRFDLDGKPCGEVAPDQIATAKASLAEMDRRQVESIAAARAAHRAEREARKAKEAAEFVEARKAEREAAERRKGPAPYHRSTPKQTHPAPPQRAGDGLAALEAAAKARKQGEVSP
jgi:sRNA-binding protein